MELSHVDDRGKAQMVDIGAKATVQRTAVASGTIRLTQETVRLIEKNGLDKGDVLACARIAGITGGKRTSDLIPLCHNISIDQISVDFALGEGCIDIIATASCCAKTGIEMEALTAVSLAALTIYDMCKAVDKEMVIGEIRLVKKTKQSVQP